jgi:hypothetical protein
MQVDHGLDPFRQREVAVIVPSGPVLGSVLLSNTLLLCCCCRRRVCSACARLPACTQLEERHCHCGPGALKAPGMAYTCCIPALETHAHVRTKPL